LRRRKMIPRMRSVVVDIDDDDVVRFHANAGQAI
jgi:hypothetical protein